MRTEARLLAIAGVAACGAMLSASTLAAPTGGSPDVPPPTPTAPSDTMGTGADLNVDTPAGRAGAKAGVGQSGASAGGGVSFADLDKGGKGYITRAEAKKDQALSKQFSKLDANHDGKLDQAEFSKFEANTPAGTPNSMPR